MCFDKRLVLGGRFLVSLLAGVFATAWPGAASAQDDATAPTTQTATTQPAEEGEGSVRTVRPGTYDLKYRDADLQVVLRQLSAQTGKNVVTTSEIKGKVSADLYGVTFREALEAMLKSAGYVYEEKGNFIYVYTPKQLEAIKKSERQMSYRTFRLSYITANDAKTLIAPVLSGEGSLAVTPPVATGIASSKTDSGGQSYGAEDMLVVRDYDENLKQVEAVLQQLDVKPEQVEIEATILRATLNESNALGIDFNTLAGVDFDAFTATTPAVQSVNPGTANVADLTLPAATFRTDFNSAVTPGGFTIGMISNNVAFFIRALEGVTDVTVMANPTLLVVNKQRGEVMVGNRNGYLTTTVTETVATQTVQFLETGTRLIVRPFVARDGYVRMEIHPEDSSGSVTQVGQSVLPNETTTEVTTNVLVRDGHTIVIGGLFRERTSNERSQVPLLGNVPYLGVLFRRTADNTQREEVIILLTPRIIKQETAEAVGEQMKDDAERMRLGQRKGLQWWGRGRLAQAHMRWARQELRKGDREKALWNVDMALSLTPRMAEAIDLKERLTEKAFWADEFRVSEVKYLIPRLIMQDLGLPVELIIPPDKPLRTGQITPNVREAFGIGPKYQEPSPEPLEDLQPVEVKEQDKPADLKKAQEGSNEPAKPAEEQ